MHIERLVTMANDISNFFAAEPDSKVAVAGIKNHIAKNWEVRMISAIIDYLQNEGGAELNDLAKAAVLQLQAETK